MMRDMVALGAVVSVLGKALLDGIREYAVERNLEIEGLPKDPKADIPRTSGRRYVGVPRELVPAACE